MSQKCLKFKNNSAYLHLVVFISKEKNFNGKKEFEDEFDQFTIKKPSVFKWIIVVFITLGSNLLWVALTEIPLTLLLVVVSGVIFFSIFFWFITGQWSVRILVLKNIKRIHVGKMGFFLKYSMKFLGMHFDKNNKYFLEKISYLRDYNSVKELFYDRLLDPVSSSLGLGFLIITFVKPLITTVPQAMIIANIVLVTTPLLSGFIIPFYWVIKDSRIRYINEKNDVFKAEENIKNSTLNKFLGFSGFVAGINFLLESLPEHPAFAHVHSTLVLFILAVIILLFISLIIAGINLFVATVYLTTKHQKLVNELRKKITNYIPVGETRVLFNNEKTEVIIL